MKWLQFLRPRLVREKTKDEEFPQLPERRLQKQQDLLERKRVKPTSRDHEGGAISAEPASVAETAAEQPDLWPEDRRHHQRAKHERWEGYIDRIIREAQQRGAFDNLPGQGRPLNMEENPWAGDWAFAFHLLKQAGEVPPWMSLGKEVAEDKERLAAQLAEATEGLRFLRTGAQTPEGIDRYESARQKARARYLDAAAELDKKLASYNGQVPTFWLDRGRLPQHIAAARFDAACPPYEEDEAAGA